MIDTKKIIISKMTLNDFEEIRDIIISKYDNFWNPKTLENELKNPNSYYVVAKLDNTTVGFAGIKQVLDEADIMNIVTKKDLRSNGIGTLLFKHLMDYAVKKGITKLTLEVNENNITAINLYKKFGFEEISKREKYYHGTESAIIMQRNLI